MSSSPRSRSPFAQGRSFDTDVAHSLTFKLRLPPKYPKAAPSVSLEQARGISDSEIDALRSSLQKLAGSLVGSEMIFELVTFASTHLTEHHSIVRAVQHSSLNEERAVRATHAHEQHQRHAEAEARRLEDLKMSEDQELARQVEEHLGKKAELVRKGRERLSSAATLDLEPSESALPTTFTLAAGSRSLQVIRGPPLRSVELGQVFFATVGSSELAQLRVVEIRGRYYESAQGRGKLARVLEDLEHLRQLRHPSLHQVLASQLSDHRLLVLTEPAPAGPLRDLLDQSGNLRADRALRYLAQLLEALATLHEAHIVHRAVTPSNMFLSTDPDGGEPIVKLANASWLQRLADLNNSNPFAEYVKDAPRPDGW